MRDTDGRTTDRTRPPLHELNGGLEEHTGGLPLEKRKLPYGKTHTPYSNEYNHRLALLYIRCMNRSYMSQGLGWLSVRLGVPAIWYIPYPPRM
ncbi:hypothetical protein SODALDRAFT_27387 [Sodiomyces alkalinus F11]|uniref:Uncharacterized protein n=1 Tax=Sodiomyces alkalinus (strain CBS 110278 / VKM F-3762 / F11) TaxID=1314773 RepID=A0A3N2Q892_SODAK|nr:hypothetical protein SODALDRAFT_27387 [Sodiomyces alkalinus F11]ROT42946.1 hypothetical protein SODALDRAFT_27387 [Sodiomyces alkalinus F11]